MTSARATDSFWPAWRNGDSRRATAAACIWTNPSPVRSLSRCSSAWRISTRRPGER
jgi:phage-related protein